MKIVKTKNNGIVLFDENIGISLSSSTVCPIIIDNKSKEFLEEYELIFNQEFRSKINNPSLIFKKCSTCDHRTKNHCVEARKKWREKLKDYSLGI